MVSRARTASNMPAKVEERYRRILGARLGLLYGVMLLAVAFKLSRDGQATDLVVQLLTAPFGLLVPEIVFTGMVVLWTLVGIGAAMARRAAIRYSVAAALVIHYSVATYAIRAHVVAENSNIAATFAAAPLLVMATLAIYLIGQATIWLVLWRSAKNSPANRRST